MIRGEIAAFLPDYPANYGNLVCYHYIGQHSEASVDYYRKGRPAKPEEYEALHKELVRIYDDCELVIRKRLDWNQITKMWSRIARKQHDAGEN